MSKRKLQLKYVDVNVFDIVTKYGVMILIGLIQLAYAVVFIWFAVNYPSEDWKWFFAGAIFLVLINLPLFFFLWIQWSIRWLQARSDYVLVKERDQNLR